MKPATVHFPDLTAQPLEKFVASGGARFFRFKSFCGFRDRNTTNDFRKVNCLLCIRSIFSQMRRAAHHSGGIELNKALTRPDLFQSVSMQIKTGKR